MGQIANQMAFDLLKKIKDRLMAKCAEKKDKEQDAQKK